MPAIKFIQNTDLGGSHNEIGLYDLFIAQFQQSYHQDNILVAKHVVVPNLATLEWIKDKLALTNGVCAHVKFNILLSQVIQSWYLANNPQVTMYDFEQAKYLIYDYLCKNKITTHDSQQLNQYIYNDNKLDKFKAYQLASQLQQIFHEYIYLRTNEMLNLGIADFKQWQKQIIRHLFEQIKPQKTFLDIYNYFVHNETLDLAELKLPNELFIFSLPNVYPSQVHIIRVLSQAIQVYWYYQPNSYEYYGDLLSNAAKNSLAKKLFKHPHLNLDDLYLNEGNPLLGAWGTGSREFIELLQIYDIEVYNYTNNKIASIPTTMLGVIQHDIRQITYRVAQEYRTNSLSTNYSDPIELPNLAKDNDKFYDLANEQSSIKINVCHNKMREVQVMFNEITRLLTCEQIKFEEIVICAPDIGRYAPYISAVFDNEVFIDDNNEQHQLAYNLVGVNYKHTHKIFETLKLILNAPFNLSVNYLLEILTQSIIQDNLDININDIEQIKLWLVENQTKFGYDESNYEIYGYKNYSIHSFKQFINNLIIGACMTNQIFEEHNELPLYSIDDVTITPYDNLDYSQLDLCNKLINLIEILESLQQTLYLDSYTYKELSVEELYEILNYLQQSLIKEESSITLLQRFTGWLTKVKIETKINLPIINLMLDEFLANLVSPIKYNWAITCASMRDIRRIPYKYTYILGLNFGEFPVIYRPHQLSILAKQWQLADRNYTLEDKQIFLDILINTKSQLFLSYIGYSENDNSEIKPSAVVNLLINTLAKSFTNIDKACGGGYDFKNIIQKHALHPFHNNKQENYSLFWQKLITNLVGNSATDKRWDFRLTSPIKLSPQQQLLYYNVNIRALTDTFIYTNNNLYKVLGLRVFKEKPNLNDKQDIELNDKSISKQVYQYFNKYYPKHDKQHLQQFLQIKGILGYEHISELQMKHYINLYNNYIQQLGNDKLQLNFKQDYLNLANEVIKLDIRDEIYYENNTIIISNKFENITNKAFTNTTQPPYQLKIQGLITALLINNPKTELNKPVKHVIIRLINSIGQKQEWQVKIGVNPDKLLDIVLRYYIRSLTNPVLVHKGAIETFIKSSQKVKNNGELEYTYEHVLELVGKAYLNNFNNYDLDKLKLDPIFGNIAIDYFTAINSYNYNNDIIKIGEILSNVEFSQIK